MSGSVLVTVTRSAGDDRAVLVFIDTDFDPRGRRGGSPGLRVILNDDEVFVGKAYDLGGNHEAESRSLNVNLDEIGYTGRETP